MKFKAKYSGLSLSSSDSSFSLSRSTELVRSMRTRPRQWILGIITSGVLFLIGLSWILSRATSQRDNLGWLQEYYSRMYGRPVPKDNAFDSLKPPIKAVILILCRNSDIGTMAATLSSFEVRFNRKYKYPYVFLNNEEFTTEFKSKIQQIIKDSSKASVEFGVVPEEHWSYPDWIDQDLASKKRQEMEAKGVVYGGSESYRFMCRYFSGFFYRHPLLLQYEYYWRVEPGVEFLCDINYDVFRFMKNKDKQYGFVISIQEIPETIPTFWKTVTEEFLPKHPRAIASHKKTPTIRFFGPPSPHGYNGCHFWSNFEIASFNFFRSKEYERYFKLLDERGGFFYERWGDAPVHSVAAGLFLRTDQIHYFHDIGYKHEPFSHCPADFMFRRAHNCACDPFEPSEVAHGVCQTLWDTHYAIS